VLLFSGSWTFALLMEVYYWVMIIGIGNGYDHVNSFYCLFVGCSYVLFMDLISVELNKIWKKTT